MKITCHELDGDRLSSSDVDESLERWKKGEGAFWLDLEGYDESSLEALLDRVGVNEFLKRRCLHAGVQTGGISIPQGTFADIMIFANPSCSKRARVSVLALKDLLITMKKHPIEEAVPMAIKLEELELGELSTSGLLCALLLEHAALTSRHGRALREKVLQLGERMDTDIESVEPEELEELIHSDLLTVAVAEEQSEAFDLLPNAKSKGFATADIQPELALLYTMAHSTERLSRRVEMRAENLIRRQSDHKQGLLNRRLGLLTIISAIFMPLTLLAGIWGMNFQHMPELDDPYAYPAALSFMGLLALIGGWIFYKRGWFD
jgi:hypothetical protein